MNGVIRSHGTKGALSLLAELLARPLPNLEGARMAELTADLFVTLDGSASGIDVGPYFGYAGPELERWVHVHLDQPQLIVMGRVTYEAMAELSSSATDEVSTRMNELPKVVLSNTLQEPLAWGNTRLVRGDLAKQAQALNSGQPTRFARSVASRW
jgi:dihydrofolate reductase